MQSRTAHKIGRRSKEPPSIPTGEGGRPCFWNFSFSPLLLSSRVCVNACVWGGICRRARTQRHNRTRSVLINIQLFHVGGENVVERKPAHQIKIEALTQHTQVRNISNVATKAKSVGEGESNVTKWTSLIPGPIRAHSYSQLPRLHTRILTPSTHSEPHTGRGWGERGDKRQTRRNRKFWHALRTSLLPTCPLAPSVSTIPSLRLSKFQEYESSHPTDAKEARRKLGNV